MKYEHIIWDWNGTLFNDSKICVHVMNGVLERRNMPLIDHAKFLKIFRFPVKEYYIELGFDFKIEPFESSGSEFIENYEHEKYRADLQPGARDALTHIQNAGIGQSILSAGKEVAVQEIVNHFELQSFFQSIRGLDHHYAHSKSEIGLACISELGIAPDKVLYIGDTVHDYEVAQEMSVHCVLFEGGYQHRHILDSCGCPVISHLSHLPALLQ